jgi:glycosyltransferase involved in cell wall biosynthesis
LNILCIDQFSTWGGGQRSLLDLLPSFTGRGWQPHVVLPDEGLFADELRRQGYATSILESHEYTSIRKPKSEMRRYAQELPKLARRIKALAADLSIDLLYVNGPRFLPPAALAARHRRIPVVFHCHHQLGQLSAVLLSGASLWFSDAHVIACCEHAVHPLRKYVDSARLSVIYNGVLSLEEAQPRSSSGIKHIGVVGRIEQEKGQLAFVEAVRHVVSHFPQRRFMIAGSPMFSNSTYYQAVVAASVGLPIEFAGWQNDICRIFSNLDIVVVPSTPLEATTRVIMEAFAFGVPVVALPSGGIPEIVTDNETGFLAQAGTAEALAERICSVLRMREDEIQVVTGKAQRVWQERFTLERYRSQVCRTLDRVANSANACACSDLPLEVPRYRR